LSVFLTVEIYCLLRLRENGGNRWAFMLPLVFALWANMNVQFVYGMAILGLTALDRTISDKRGIEQRHPSPRVLWMVLVGSFLATFLNPYGFHLYNVVGQYLRQSAPLQVISEM
jgi:predicted acyltransferase